MRGGAWVRAAPHRRRSVRPRRAAARRSTTTRAQEAFQPTKASCPSRAGHADSFSLLQAARPSTGAGVRVGRADLAFGRQGSLGDAVGRTPEPPASWSRRAPRTFQAGSSFIPTCTQARPGQRLDGRGDRDARNVETVDSGIYRGAFGSRQTQSCTHDAAAFPDADRDPALTPETTRALEPHRDRITDAAIHEWSDVEALPARRRLNPVPSRFGSVKRLFDFYACATNRSGSTAAVSWSSAPAAARFSCSHAVPRRRTNDVAPGDCERGRACGSLPQPLFTSNRAPVS